MPIGLWYCLAQWPTRSQIVRHYEPPHHAQSNQGLCCVNPQMQFIEWQEAK